MSSQQHWDAVYRNKPSQTVSWFQPTAEVSLQLIESAKLLTQARIIDIGGGASTLVDDLLRLNKYQLSVLDLSGAALDVAKTRLGASAQQVSWLVGDITDMTLPTATYDLWHDRAVFHFLTTPEARCAYVAQVRRALKPGGHLLMATFASDGPERCSELPVVRYEPDQLLAELGGGFELLQQVREAHQTPGGRVQHFVYAHFVKAD